MTHGGMSTGYWGVAPLDFPVEPPVFEPPPAIKAMMEGRGTGVYGGLGGPPYNYGWPKWGPVSSNNISKWQLTASDAAQARTRWLRREAQPLRPLFPARLLQDSSVGLYATLPVIVSFICDD